MEKIKKKIGEIDIMKAYEMYKKAYEHGFYDGLIMKEKIEKIKGWS